MPRWTSARVSGGLPGVTTPIVEPGGAARATNPFTCALYDLITVDPTAIPWVRLSAASTTPGRLGNTTYIQRIATTGGLAPPAAECDAATAGTVDEVPYTADYYFWKKTGA
jgi:hypothetical protein